MFDFNSGLVKVAIPIAAIAVVLWRTRKRSAADMGYVSPPVWQALALIALYLAWMVASDALLHWRGPWDFSPWVRGGWQQGALRVLAVCVLGPIAEELIFRGWIYGALVKTRAGVAGAIVLTAAGWAVLHYAYDWRVIGVIFVDGLLLGLTRWRTRSIFPNFAQHMLYNLYAIW